ncbi:threonine/serine exporter family protein [Paenibacillus sp. HN-1]|uniref:threonine/serine exporter family protein n=1 Tax=Paenibacillus TaxID=44249 RepID=UPI001CA7DB74|nr:MULTISPECIES: threonine/serine exporter family protein [Paenibacillus]MBY9079653.1 threonine/serine exporter family protein [Paenibacillus sp. CGMCC 1.18879]MBY9082904.1 threonine/serine exporter family protein [Paenibacillus sinensis]
MIVQLLTSFIASATFCILFNTPRRMLLPCGLAGMLGWMVYLLLSPDWKPVVATFFATVIVGAVSQIFARVFKMPVIIFSVGGIIPLVPGGLAYDAMRRFVEDDYSTALQVAVQALLLSGAIAAGLVLSEVLGQMFRRRRV